MLNVKAKVEFTGVEKKYGVEVSAAIQEVNRIMMVL